MVSTKENDALRDVDRLQSMVTQLYQCRVRLVVIHGHPLLTNATHLMGLPTNQGII